ncbi:fasciclin domain-containing protein [Sneathiella chungangensis]|uniref:Fasciclin domain-containing protein n=1 Tax=Sneathiella chungangensis TaxID=1418234 RepID=A0A845MCI1_9PROT|nr:fasciclin domain-containing protein [Sneathiella chungangensis]MZR20877.1 fasciclin domain-containing protein [Sneathiella chungangensis]
MSKILKLVSTFLIVGVFATACAQDAKMAKKPMPAEKDIVATAVDAGQFNTLVAALKAAGLVETLQSPGPFTVFAPTDDAFAKLPAGTVENLLKPENKEKLVQVLTYHVVSGNVPASAVVGKMVDATSVEGSTIMINGMDGVMLNGSAKVVAADVMASNGVIHVIDTVILPPSK